MPMQKPKESKSEKEQEAIAEKVEEPQSESKIDSHSEESSAGNEPTENRSLIFSTIGQSIRKIWLACIGSVITLEHRIAKGFNRLVQKGARYQYHVKTQSSNKSENQSAPTETGKLVKERLRAVDKMHDLENSIELKLDKGRTNTLHWMGVSSRNDFKQLQDEVLELSKQVKMIQQLLTQKESEADHKKPGEAST